ncbi:hypothetical protein C7B65_08470 [Phormidesmis priestleyi ULC007]|uniref:Uncharacterized protein n=1 Tax=Phormidesmis priestleyi ULC007 TaxID=1920490 RepID=A0A2T1DHX5_9CYAN|nr:hypothetical protein [Phormidesmis priestleyi]PSB20082.1 hypothetical protein C7B65_08470 [Phormidesmis priestleyi ULC007]PZO48946.1 MAG: hypothetical protein DCF14_15485 [Phormidesmis priestleyi]
MNEQHLRVYSNRSELILPDGTIQLFPEGVMNQAAKDRHRKIILELSEGYLETQILLCRNQSSMLNFSELPHLQRELLDKLVQSVTSEVGRAVVGLSILQLCLKAIEPEQNIRLHKGGKSIKKDFSWCDGISMRSLDKNYITPVLRKYDLLKLNADGFMMTRTLAENYPYSSMYKAYIRGARIEWMQIVEAIENREVVPILALQYLLSQLINQADNFGRLALQVIEKLNLFFEATIVDREISLGFILRHINRSDYAARLMEIAMHSLMQAMQDYQVFPDSLLKPLSQMRSANKKHGNVGDIELLEDRRIVEAWDAKYGKSYLRDEIEELSEKLEVHSAIRLAGFVTSLEPERLDELKPRCEAIEEIYGISLEILTFGEWVEEQFERALIEETVSEQELAAAWLIAYAESLAQRRREIAPIDEPCYQWLSTMNDILIEELLDTPNS